MKALEIGVGHVEIHSGYAWDLILPPTGTGYSDAQIDDCHTLKRDQFPWSPPLRMTLRARVSSPSPIGTFGFGFWNDPFALSLGLSGVARKFPASPSCLWFFYGAPPHDLALVDGIAGWGWKAQVLRTRALPGALLLPAAGALLLARLKPLRSAIVQTGRRMAAVDEALLETPHSNWHSYAMDWTRHGVCFHVDGELVLNSDISPQGPLGFVAWIDNQYAVFSPHKGISFGVVTTQKQARLEITDLRIEPIGG